MSTTLHEPPRHFGQGSTAHAVDGKPWREVVPLPQSQAMTNNTTPGFEPLFPTPEALRAEADALAREEAPRLFAVLALNHEEGDGVIIAWGQLFRNGHVTLTGAAFPVRGSFGSLRSALRFCERGPTDTHITWIDQEPAPNRSVAYDPRTGTGKTHEPHKTRSVEA